MADRKTCKLMEIWYPVRYEVIFHYDGSSTPFWLYRRDRAVNKDGYSYWSRKLIVKVGYMETCLRYIINHME